MSEQTNISSITFAGYMPRGKGTPIHKNRQAHGLVFNLGSTSSYAFDTGEVLTVHSGECIYLPRGSNYIARCLEFAEGTGNGVYAINFLVLNEEIHRPMAKKIKHRDEILSLFSKAAREWIKKSDGYYEKCMSYLYRIIWRLKSEVSVSYTTRPGETKISPAIEYIRENYTADSIKISHLASLCGISEVALRKQFQKQFAISPAVYIRNMRINYAKELMSNQDVSIADVAMLSGFNDVSYFSREFKKSEGISPKEYKSLHET